MNKLKHYLKRIYRLSVSSQRKERIVWNDLKILHAVSNWDSGVYEKDQYIETIFQISDEKPEVFYYTVNGGNFHCWVKILEEFSDDLTTDFIYTVSSL